MSAAARERFSVDELRRLAWIFVLNALVPTLFLLGERAAFNQDPRGYLEFAHLLARIGLLPPDTMLREWTVWEEAYSYARPGANFGYEAQAYVIFIIPAIFLAFHLAMESREASRRNLALLVAAVLLSGLVLSLSRTGIFAFAACCFLYARSKHKFTFLAFGAALIAVLLIALPNNYFLQRYTMQSADAYSFSYKFLQIANAFKATFSSPVSLVFGNPALMDKSIGGFNPHNQFLSDLMLKGTAAFALGLGMFWALLRRLRDTVDEEDPAGPKHRFARIVRVCILSCFIQCFSTQVLPNTNTSIVFWLSVFFVLQLTRQGKSVRIAW